MRTLKLTLSYDGTRLVGWQRQAEGDSVQGAARGRAGAVRGRAGHGARRRAHRCRRARARAGGQRAGHLRPRRRDAGPRAQRAAARRRARARGGGGRGGLSRPLRRAVEDLPLSACATTRVASPFERAFVWHVPQPLDVDAMQQAAARLLGRHDFAAFRSVGTDVAGPVRTLTVSTVCPGGRPTSAVAW